MNKLFIVTNLKSNKNENEAKIWLEGFKKIKEIEGSLLEKEIVVCPSFTELSLFKSFTLENNLPVKLGAQNVSPFDEGAYTGEVNAKQIRDYSDYVLIGHSERRNNFNESQDQLSQKVEVSLKYGLTPIFCVQGSGNKIPNGIKILAYEPLFAIGSGNPDTPQNADKVAKEYLSNSNDYHILYGGSVTSDNVSSFTKMENINGVLVGGAGLDFEEFIKIIENA